MLEGRWKHPQSAQKNLCRNLQLLGTIGTVALWSKTVLQLERISVFSLSSLRLAFRFVFFFLRRKINSIYLFEFSFCCFLAHLLWKLKWAVVCLSLRLLHFRPFLQNLSASSNQNWHKSSLEKGIQNSSNEEQRPCTRADNSKTVEMHWKFL
jgi:hypothetical protein